MLGWKILKGILDFYSEVLGQQIHDFHMPDVQAIGKQNILHLPGIPHFTIKHVKQQILHAYATEFSYPVML